MSPAPGAAPRVIDPATAEARLRALLKSGFGPGLPRREADRWILLYAIAGTFDDAEKLGEQAFTERLTQWLATTGGKLETDAVTLRRALVDDGFVERDGRGQAYHRSRDYEKRVVFPPAAATAPSAGAGLVPGLAHERCTACHPGAPRVEDDEARTLLAELPAWSIEVVDGVARLSRAFAFPDFKSALAFADRVGEEAEAEDHHPELVVAWGKVTVGWWTHAIGGLHRNDFVMAARTSSLAGAASPA